ncbi:MAG: hypothetical protein P4L28_06000, partial [Paludibacteraceae bacterium]|nr:hypothetical protein [Paludibacteraceae bacterium]
MQGAIIYPFSIRAQYSGRYDIKMIAAPNLEPVYIDAAQAASKVMKVDSVINPKTIMLTSTLLDINNRYKPFPKTAKVPLSAVLCPSGKAPCAAGYTITTSGSCPAGKWGTINYITPDPTVSMAYPDYDADVSTFSSSYAYLDIPSCAEVQAAYLYWAGMKQGTNPLITAYTPTASYTGSGDIYRTGVTGSSDYKTVKLKAPGMTSYSDVTAIKTYEGSTMTDTYICIADITSIIKGKSAGNYWVGNIRTYPTEDADGGGGSSSGWTMVIIYKSPISAPRALVLYDGVGSVSGSNDYLDFSLSGITAPSTSNFKSYLGYAVLDGENSAPELLGKSNFALTPSVTQLDGTNIANNSAAECVQFTANGGAPSVYLNPFYGDTVRYYNKKGEPSPDGSASIVDACKIPIYTDPTWGYGFDGASSSRISTYDETTNTNGNEIVRKPSGRYTMGYDSHMMLLPKTAIASGTTSATMRVYAGSQGGTTPFMAFIAIETNQPRLMLYKTPITSSTTVTLADTITYQLKIKNAGSLASTAGDAYLYDSLGIQCDYVPGSFKVVRGSAITPTVTGLGTDAQVLALTNMQSITSNDSVVYTFKVTLKPLSRTDIWSVPCRRTVRNRAYLYFKPDATYTTPVSTMSNGGSCGEPGANAEVNLSDPASFATIDSKLAFTKNISQAVIANPSMSILSAVDQVLTDSAGVASTSSYVITNASGTTITSSDVFNTSDPIQVFTATQTFTDGINGTCTKAYTITLILGKVPNMALTATQPTCNGLADGTINVKATDGSTTETYKIYVYVGTYSTSNPVPTGTTALLGPISYVGGSTTVNIGTVNLLGAGSYTAVAVPTINTAIPTTYKNIIITQPIVVTTTISGKAAVCIGSADTLTAGVSGGPTGGTVSYQWQKSADGTTWSNLLGETSSKTIQTINTNTYFRAIGNVNTCSGTSSFIQVTASPIPTVTLMSDTSVSISITPTTATFRTKVTNAVGTMKYHWT